MSSINVWRSDQRAFRAALAAGVVLLFALPASASAAAPKWHRGIPSRQLAAAVKAMNGVSVATERDVFSTIIAGTSITTKTQEDFDSVAAYSDQSVGGSLNELATGGEYYFRADASSSSCWYAASSLASAEADGFEPVESPAEVTTYLAEYARQDVRKAQWRVQKHLLTVRFYFVVYNRHKVVETGFDQLVINETSGRLQSASSSAEAPAMTTSYSSRFTYPASIVEHPAPTNICAT